MKKILTLLAAMLISIAMSAQTTLYSQNFGTSSFPPGDDYDYVSGAWSFSVTYSSSDIHVFHDPSGLPVCTVAGSSQNNALVCLNTYGTVESIVFLPVSTVGYSSIAVTVNEYKWDDDYSAYTSWYWSTDTITWHQFNMKSSVGAWGAIYKLPASSYLPTGAANKSALYIKLEFDENASGYPTSYDDFKITGFASALKMSAPKSKMKQRPKLERKIAKKKK